MSLIYGCFWKSDKTYGSVPQGIPSYPDLAIVSYLQWILNQLPQAEFTLLTW